MNTVSQDRGADTTPLPQEGLGARFGAVGRLAGVQVRRAAVAVADLPRAYRALGRHVHEHHLHADVLGDAHARVGELLSELQRLRAAGADATPPVASMARAKAAVAATGRAARAKAAEGHLAAAYGTLGRAAYEQFREEAGPPHVVGPVRDAADRLRQLDDEAARLTAVGAGARLTPRRIIFGLGGVCALAVALLLWGTIGALAVVVAGSSST